MVIDPEVYSRDRAEYKKTSGPKWKAKYLLTDSNIVFTRRPRNFHKFIMDIIKESAEKEMKRHLLAYDELTQGANATSWDEDLLSPYLEAKKNADIVLGSYGCRGKLDELEIITKHVRRVRALHRERISNMSKKTRHSDKKAAEKNTAFTSLAIEKRQDILRALSKEFVSGPKDLVFFQSAELEKVRASYAYLHDCQELETKSRRSDRWTRFPWDVAMRELCGEHTDK